MKKKTGKILTGLFLILISSYLTGCGEDALASLRSNEVSARYNKTYWQSEKKNHTETWQKAVAICNESMGAALKPNCQVLANVAGEQWVFKDVPKMPKYGSGKGFR